MKTVNFNKFKSKKSEIKVNRFNRNEEQELGLDVTNIVPESKSLTANINGDENKFIDSKKDNTKIRVDAENWTFTEDDYSHEKQISMLKDIQANNFSSIDKKTKIAIQQINKKINSYKQQDLIKNLYSQEKHIHLQSIINKMIDCDLKCYYCSISMSVLYDISREMKQWTVDRIDNDLGHYLDNYYLACLECNLRRRRRSDDKFLFTKQLKIVKSSQV